MVAAAQQEVILRDGRDLIRLFLLCFYPRFFILDLDLCFPVLNLLDDFGLSRVL